MNQSYLSPAQEKWLKSHPELTATGSMLRRSPWHDYSAPSIYMITLVTCGRKQLLGILCDPDKTHTKPWVRLSQLGKEVKRVWNEIPLYHPQVKLLSMCIMPDHIHGIIYVTERLPRHLGHVINGFKKGCNDAMRKYLGTVECSEALPRTTTHPQKQPGTGLLWQQGYHDRILTHKGQLSTLFQYVADNPRRLWLKRRHKEYFTIIHNIEIDGNFYDAMGNIDILKHPFKCPVQCSRSLTDTQVEEVCSKFVAQAAHGTVLVSPCISNGEKTVMAMAMQLEYPVIILMNNGFDPKGKPSQRFIDACARGNALFIAPLTRHPQSEKLTRNQCLVLNTLASTIATL